MFCFATNRYLIDLKQHICIASKTLQRLNFTKQIVSFVRKTNKRFLVFFFVCFFVLVLVFLFVSFCIFLVKRKNIKQTKTKQKQSKAKQN